MKSSMFVEPDSTGISRNYDDDGSSTTSSDPDTLDKVLEVNIDNMQSCLIVKK